MSTNSDLLNKYSYFNGSSVQMNVSPETFQADYTTLRSMFSKNYTYNNKSYPSIYLSDYDYAIFTFSLDGIVVKPIVNLECFYVYGFYYPDNTVYAFSGEGNDSLVKLGFTTNVIPYSDGYSDIIANSSKYDLPDMTKEQVSMDKLKAAFQSLSDNSQPFTEKSNDLLVFLWSLIEGLRYHSVSDVIFATLQGKEPNVTYNSFFLIAKKWGDLSYDVARSGITIPQIAIYNLHGLGFGVSDSYATSSSPKSL